MKHESHKSKVIQEFLFLANHPALDFVNTRPVIDGRERELLPDFAAVLRWFEAESWISHADAVRLQKETEKQLAAALVLRIQAFREDFRAVLNQWEHGKSVPRSFLDQLNRLMAEHPMLHRVGTSSSGTTSELWFNAAQPDVLFAPLAYYVATLFSEQDHARVRQCDACVLHFLDTSKKGTRRWCSMQICGNRAKVAAFAARAERR